MPSVARLGDSNSGGGTITSVPQTTVFADGMPISVNGSTGTSHRKKHKHKAGVWRTANGSSTVTINNIPVNFQGNADTCGHTRVGGSPTIFIE